MKKSQAKGKHTIKRLRCVTYHTFVFNIAYAGVSKCNGIPFSSRLVYPDHSSIFVNMCR